MSSKQKQDLIDRVTDLISKMELEDRFQTRKETEANVEQFLQSYNGSYLDLFLVLDRLKRIADQGIDKELKTKAHTEFLLQYGNEKNTHKGNDITPVAGYAKYDYPEDDYISKAEKDLEAVKKEMAPLKKVEKRIKNSIKERKQELVDEGKAKQTSITKYLKVSK